MDTALIPTGRVIGVQGTSLDLTKPTQLVKVSPFPISAGRTNCQIAHKVLDTCPGGEYAGFSHTYVVEENVVETNGGKMVEKASGEMDTLAHCATVEERRRFEIITFSLCLCFPPFSVALVSGC